MLSQIKGPLRRGARYLFDRMGVRVEIHRRRPAWAAASDRLSYQARYVDFKIQPGERVLDIGNGGYPFPYATVLADRFPSRSPSRFEPLVRKDKPFVLADIHNLPFVAKGFDFVYCSHVLGLIDDPLSACEEIMRVGKRGFIESPTFGKDVLFAWGKSFGEKWHVAAIGSNLCFFEYTERQLEGIRSSVWRELVMAKWLNPVQTIFWENLDLFNVLFTWEHEFSVFLFRLDGTVKTLNAKV